MTTAKVIIEYPGDDFYRGVPVKLKIRLEAEDTSSRLVVISSDAFSPKDKTINLKPSTDPRDAIQVEFNPWQGAKVNHAYAITAAGGDSRITAETDQAYQITYKYPTVTFDGLPEKNYGRVTIRLALNKPLAVGETAEAVVSGDCLEPGKAGWLQEDNGYLFKFFDESRWETLYLHVKETGFADSTLTLKAKLRCVTASTGTTHDLQLTSQKLPKLQFGEPPLKAEKIPGTDKYQIGTGELVCQLDAEALSKGATAEITGDYLERPIPITYKSGKKQTAPVSINLKSTDGQTKKLTLKAIDGCELDNATEKTKIEIQVEDPKLAFEDSTPLEADTVPNKSETFRVGKATLRCKVSYWLAKNESPGRLAGDCLKTPVDLAFESDSVASGTAWLKDTGGKAATVTLQPAKGYVLDTEGTTSLDVTVESPKVKFTENPTDAKKHPHKRDVYQIGQASFSCESTYRLPGSQAPATLSGGAIEDDVILFFPDERATTAKAKAVLKDTDGQSVKLALIPEEGRTADPAAAPRLKWRRNHRAYLSAKKHLTAKRYRITARPSGKAR